MHKSRALLNLIPLQWKICTRLFWLALKRLWQTKVEGAMNMFLDWMSTLDVPFIERSYDVKESFLATNAKMSLRVPWGEILENKSKRIQIKSKSPEALAFIGWVHRHFWMRPDLEILQRQLGWNQHMHGKTRVLIGQ